MTRERALSLLETDRALTGRQLYRCYGIHPRLLTNLGRRDVTLGPRKNWSGTPITVRFYGLHQRDLDRLHPAALGHYAGIADMRYRLNVGGARWQISRSGSQGRLQRKQSGCLPDAVYKGETGRVAVEYDTGTYSTSLVVEKLEAYYLDHAATVWGVTSPLRQRRVRELAAAYGFRIQVIDATWWLH